MLPSYSNGDVVLVKKFSNKYRAGDVIVAEVSDTVTKHKIVKRIVAEGNSRVFIDNFRVFVNDEEFLESTQNPPSWDRDVFKCRFSSVYTTNIGEYFALGDNRCHSLDSRIVGPFGVKSIVGKVVRKIF